jgi:hypothetical protein
MHALRETEEAAGRGSRERLGDGVGITSARAYRIWPIEMRHEARDAEKNRGSTLRRLSIPLFLSQLGPALICAF